MQSEIEAFLQEKAAKGEKADFIFMDLDKPMYARCYALVMEKGLLAQGGIMLCDNVLYRGLTAQYNAGEMPAVSERPRQTRQPWTGSSDSCARTRPRRRSAR